jgi:hypothetical protein
MLMTIASLIRAFFGVYGNTEDRDPGGTKFRIKAAVALLVIYAVMHLTVGGILHLVGADRSLADVVQADCMPE